MGVMRRLIAPCLAILLVGGVVSERDAASASASFPGQDGVIAYPGTVPGAESESQIWAIDLASGEQLRLTSGPFDTHPSFSPTGEMLAFERHQLVAVASGGAPKLSQSAGIYVVDADGSDPRFVTVGSEPAFGPSGREIVFVRGGSIYATPTTPGARPRRIVRGPGDSAPSWSVTGEILFEHSQQVVRQNEGRRYRELLDQLDLTRAPFRRVQSIFTFEKGSGQREEDQTNDFFPDAAPEGQNIVVSLCGAGPELEGTVPTSPKLVVRIGCGPTVWLPDGRGLFAVSNVATSIFGVKESTCPLILNDLTEIAYQPLHNGSSQVPVVPCHTVSEGPTSGIAPSEEVFGSRICYTLHQRRHCRLARG